MLGADVIHVESVKHPDGMRGHSVLTTDDDLWWEWTPRYHGPNANKRGITIDMETERGQDLARSLIAECDVMVENFSPRVMEQWGLEYEAVRAIRNDIIFLRMPAFGLSGPWRNRTGYAQNMEQVSGMAWVTGYPDGPPRVPNGMCDPVAGTHATLALLLALEHRRKTGLGMLVEVAMVGGALNIAAEQVVEFGSYGHLINRDGNRGPTAAPQNLYLSRDLDTAGRHEGWVAISIETDDQWLSMRKALGDPEWACSAQLQTAEGRRGGADLIDERLSEWCGSRSRDEIVTTLWPLGVPVAKVVSPADVDSLPQLASRGFFAPVTHPITGTNVHSGYPVRFSNGPHLMQRKPAPTLGEHNEAVFCDLLGLSTDELVELERQQIVGSRLVGEHRTR
jgi:crotonobetainyl-CoA:carnitine CoA-transferase CaiB-like acyl-CoA transferase